MLSVLLLHAPMTQCPYDPVPQRLRDDKYQVSGITYMSFVLMISHKIKFVLKLRIASDSGSASKNNPKHNYVKTIPYSKHPKIDDDAQILLFATRLYKT
ncbi:MAG: hypothetical protein EZS28_021069 [Streblomastix strix]|uniref:Uncharacterized protein n=1 Tax=Streblomastix strix TaxID=222440 RepID=A0A5J4VMA5_9EUKA|nr:MAG: hypothetical protein EZS28_021069 [Streblomastix strix]